MDNFQFIIYLLIMAGSTYLIRAVPFAAANASSIPSVVSWSESAMAANPFLTAYSTSSVGVKLPSDLVECVCKSTAFMLE